MPSLKEIAERGPEEPPSLIDTSQIVNFCITLFQYFYGYFEGNCL